jgi:hypothetical protein
MKAGQKFLSFQLSLFADKLVPLDLDKCNKFPIFEQEFFKLIL